MHVRGVQKYCFSLSNMQICGGFVAVVVLPSLGPREEHIVFAYQMWKPQFLSVVQFPFDNCHSPFFPTTFFEIGLSDHSICLLQRRFYQSLCNNHKKSPECSFLSDVFVTVAVVAAVKLPNIETTTGRLALHHG